MRIVLQLIHYTVYFFERFRISKLMHAILSIDPNDYYLQDIVDWNSVAQLDFNPLTVPIHFLALTVFGVIYDPIHNLYGK